MTGTSASGGTAPAARMDHVMVLLDGAAHRDVESSTYLAERFARLRRKEAESSVAGQYSTIGVAGDATLIEIFGTELPSRAPLTGGLVLSFEEPGSSQRARALLDAGDDVKYHADLVRRTVPGSGEQQPWYHLISVDLGEASPLLLFLNEVTPEYFTGLGAAPEADGAMRREAYLEAVLETPADPSRLLRDVVGVALTVRPERARRIATALGALGWDRSAGPARPVLTGPDLQLRLDEDDAATERVTEVTLAVSAGAAADGDPTELRFGGTSRLVVDHDAGRAVWTF